MPLVTPSNSKQNLQNLRKNKTPLPKAPPLEEELKRSLCKLPIELLLKILEFYGGKFDQSCGSNRKKFLMLYFGKFTRSGQRDCKPKFLFRKLELDPAKPYQRSELLRLVQSMGAHGANIVMKQPFSKLLFDIAVADEEKALSQTRKTLKLLPIDKITGLVAKHTLLPPEALRICLEAMANTLEEIQLIQDKYLMYDFDVFKKIKFPKLRVLRWKGYSLKKGDLKEQDIIDFSINTPSLTTIDIQTSVSSVFRFAEAIKHWPNLRTVRSVLKGENGGSANGWATVYDTPPERAQAEFFSNLGPKLVTLSLDHEYIYPGMLKRLSNRSIRTAEFISCGLGYSFTSLLAIPSLKKLKLGLIENVSIEGSTEVACELNELIINRSPQLTIDSLFKFKALRSLTVTDQDINDRFVEILSAELPYLEYLDISGNPVTNNGITILSKNCKYLKSIRASQCNITQMSLPKEIRDKIVP
ncbi:predicted protein [Naegleria gruberi]|uniref:Predicted protein n=1 Tax=Naegleria gruberi TaxID=5762 RepID=D2VCS8_NAEGR|nr:uncharacterized protein NAEGRDRAFT_66678 [Naegleria gruberi]EFC45471.1 predicted protein [Naegleria gruberi]|eukprot:XP_002678215.1 predicted protein [Naegleria gruberi strain NEG-M]